MCKVDQLNDILDTQQDVSILLSCGDKVLNVSDEALQDTWLAKGDALIYSYSFFYNGATMLPETIVTVAAAWWLGKQLDFRKPKLGAAVRERAKTSVAATVLTVIGSLLLTVVVVFDLICLTVAFMGALAAAGFDSAAFTLTAAVAFVPSELTKYVSARL